MKHGLDPSSILHIAKEKSIIPRELTAPTIQQCSSQLRNARRDVKTLVAESFIWRETEQQKQIEQHEQSGNESNKKRAAILRRIMRAEALMKLSEKIRRLCSEWKVIDVPTEVVSQVQSRNRTHFRQAKGKPFTVSPLIDMLGFSGEGEDSDNILQRGSEDFPDLKKMSSSYSTILNWRTKLQISNLFQQSQMSSFKESLKCGKNTQRHPLQAFI